ncbi:ATP-binding protein [Corynebacterium sp. H113]|uniref:ATP-binding protein n=1 Tax=Corynebacterium sp. H113 TaxID=3133419 RepID=UPI0030A46608
MTSHTASFPDTLARPTAAGAVPGFPFTAIVGQERLQLALILTAISPEIGGVIVRGEKGTAKTTTVRALEPFLDGQLVNLPLGATEDRVVGSINVESVLTTGKAEFQPGLLSAANGGILYVDEVNLLPDHLVDVLLDAASTGRITVERDGVSFVEQTRFVLVGTMNPEEGELRPQLLDRFGLAVDVVASREPSTRVEIVRRRLAYDSNACTFISQYADAEEATRRRLVRAKTLLQDVELDDVALGRIASLCAAFDVDGMRADLVIARTAQAHAAWRVAAHETDANDISTDDSRVSSKDTPNASEDSRLQVTDDDIRIAAEMALPHRRRRDPFDEPGLDDQQIDNAMEQARDDFPDETETTAPQEPDSIPEELNPEDSAHNPAESEPKELPSQGSDGKAGSASSGAPFPRS